MLLARSLPLRRDIFVLSTRTPVMRAASSKHTALLQISPGPSPLLTRSLDRRSSSSALDTVCLQPTRPFHVAPTNASDIRDPNYGQLASSSVLQDPRALGPVPFRPAVRLLSSWTKCAAPFAQPRPSIRFRTSDGTYRFGIHAKTLCNAPRVHDAPMILAGNAPRGSDSFDPKVPLRIKSKNAG